MSLALTKLKMTAENWVLTIEKNDQNILIINESVQLWNAVFVNMEINHWSKLKVCLKCWKYYQLFVLDYMFVLLYCLDDILPGLPLHRFESVFNASIF